MSTPGNRTVSVGLTVSIAETLALATAAVVTGSAGLRTQTVTSLADIAGGVFLLVGVLSSVRPADDWHPLGYGRERFFWSFVAAVAIFIGGFGAAVAETIQASLHPRPVGAYVLGYGVLATVIVLDAVSLVVGLRPLVASARRRRVPVTTLLWHGTDPAVTTVVLSSAAGLTGGLLAAAGLAGRQVTGVASLDAAASALIGLVLLATSIILLHSNRELLTGRGVSLDQIARMRAVVSRQPGVLAVPDIFAVVVGPASLIVDGDVVFDDQLDVPAVEAVIVSAAMELRAEIPAVSYVYLNPVAERRPRAAPLRTHVPGRVHEQRR